MGKTRDNPPLVIIHVCPHCGHKMVSRNGRRYPPTRCPSCKADITEPLLTLVGTTPARRKKGKNILLKLIGACKTGKKNGSLRHDDYIYGK